MIGPKQTVWDVSEDRSTLTCTSCGEQRPNTPETIMEFHKHGHACPAKEEK